MKYLTIFVVLGVVCTVCTARAKVDPIIWKNLEDNETTNILVTFKNANTQAAVARFLSLGLTDRHAILNTHHAILKQHADTVHAAVKMMLDFVGIRKKHETHQLWISTEMIVNNVDREVVEMLEKHPHVASLTADWFLPVQQVTRTTKTNQYGVEKVNAPAAWASFNNGNGVTVGIIDTGAQYTHEALIDSYRGSPVGFAGDLTRINHTYNWLDAANDPPSATPTDVHGHGTHVTGIICGTKLGIGVAPGAKWIHCRAGTSRTFSTQALLRCANWMACPTNGMGSIPDCSKAPHVINNSYGTDGGNPFFDSVIKAWNNAGIVSLFAASNDGNNCGNIGSPADSQYAIAVGSTDEYDTISEFSSVGPTKDNRRKPDIAAPGSNIVSAYIYGNTSYAYMSGTSMATPNAAGVAALIVGSFISKSTSYTVAKVANALTKGAVQTTSIGQTCGGIPDTVYPNNDVGYGRINALNSLKSL